MKNIPFFLILLFYLITGNAFSQKKCKFNENEGMPEAAISENCSVSEGVSTRGRILIEERRYTLFYQFVKDGDHYFFYMGMVSNPAGSHFEILVNNTIDFYLENGKVLKLFPCGDFAGKSSWGSYSIGCYYEITREQLQVLTENYLEYLHLHFTYEKDIRNSQIDEDGSRFFEIKLSRLIRPQKVKEGIVELANCILSI